MKDIERKNIILRGKVTSIERNVKGTAREDGKNDIPIKIMLDNSYSVEFSEKADMDIGDDMLILAEKYHYAYPAIYLYNAYYNISKDIRNVRYMSNEKIRGLPGTLFCLVLFIIFIGKYLSDPNAFSLSILILSSLFISYWIYDLHKKNIEKDKFAIETTKLLDSEIQKLN